MKKNFGLLLSTLVSKVKTVSKSFVSNASKKKTVKPKARPKKKQQSMKNKHTFSATLLNYAKTAFWIVVTIVFVVLAIQGKITPEHFLTLVGIFVPLL